MLKEIRKENRITQYVRETRAELRKVVWPTREEAINLTGIVVSTIVLMSIFFGAIDYVLSALVKFLLTR
ncbi:Protein translocase subunit SecE [Gammaproteobacteria bacterium]|nr:Protein translocase subunit SecE [Gammaproteobacteria bacterium]